MSNKIVKGKFYHILPILNHEVHGIRIDSGTSHSDFSSILNTEIQHQPVVFPPMDAQKRSDNIVVKLTNVNNFLDEKVKFTELKKQKIHNDKKVNLHLKVND